MADISIVMKDGRVLSELAKEERQKAYAALVERYYVELSKDVANKPQEYAWPDKSAEEVQRVVVRMMVAIDRGSAANSNALRRAAKSVGLSGAMNQTRAFVRQCLVDVAEATKGEAK